MRARDFNFVETGIQLMLNIYAFARGIIEPNGEFKRFFLWVVDIKCEMFVFTPVLAEFFRVDAGQASLGIDNF